VLPNASGTRVRLAGDPPASSIFCPEGWIEVVEGKGRPTDRELKLVLGGGVGTGPKQSGSQTGEPADPSETDGGMIL
jgi:hypothetical protein